MGFDCNRCPARAFRAPRPYGNLPAVNLERTDDEIAGSPGMDQVRAFSISPSEPYASSQTICRFCNAPKCGTNPWDRILWETEHFLVVPSKGGFVPGWLMLIPKMHVLSMAQLPSSLSIEFEALFAEVCYQLQCAFGVATAFEHGASQPNTTFGCGIDHAHLHVVPLPRHLDLKAIAEEALNQNFSTDLPSPCHPYLRIRDPRDMAWYTLEPKATIPRQFFRQIIWRSSQWIAPSYDYDEAPCDVQVRATIATLTANTYG